MPRGEQSADIYQFLNVFYRRKGIIIAVFLTVFSLAIDLAMILPNFYLSSALILVTPQRLPRSYVASTVTLTVQERVEAITQQILSRSSLERIVTNFNIRPVSGRETTVQERVGELRKRIRIEIEPTRLRSRIPADPSQNAIAFLLSYYGESPDKATQVTSRLVSLFIEENLRIREQQALGTTSFIKTEADRVQEELEKQEKEVNRYKAEYRFELPEQLDANLRTLEQLRKELQNNAVLLSSLRERNAVLEKQLAEAGAPVQQNASGWEAKQRQLIDQKKAQVEALFLQYTGKHPDIVRLKREIHALEEEVTRGEPVTKGTPSGAAGSVGNPVWETLRKQITANLLEIKLLESKTEILQGQIASYQRRVDNTPLRSIELAKISRKYEITLRKYQDLLAKTMESQVAGEMEKQQKSEQFQLLEPASVPWKPISPNRPRMLFIGLLVALAAGLSVGYLRDVLDTSFKRSEEVEGYIDLPLLASLPAVSTRRSVLEKWRAQRLLVLASVGVVAVGMAIMRFFAAAVF